MSGPRYDPARGWMSPEDLAEERLGEVYAMNRRVKAELGQVIGVLRLAHEDGARDVMHDAISEVISSLSSLIDDD